MDKGDQQKEPMAEEKKEGADEEQMVMDGDDEDGPAFVDDGMEEVTGVDLEHEPMMEDEENDEEEDGGERQMAATNESTTTQLEDMSKISLKCHTGPVYCVTCSKIGENKILVVSGGGDDKAFLNVVERNSESGTYTLVSAQELTPPNGPPHTDTISCVVFGHDETSQYPTMLATGGYDGNVHLWTLDKDGKAIYNKTLDGPSDVEWLQFHPKGSTVIMAGSTDGTIWMWHVSTGKCLQVFVGHSNDVTGGKFTPPNEGKSIATIGVDATLRLWAPKKGTCRHVFGGGSGGNEIFATEALTCLDITTDSTEQQLALCGSIDGTAWLVNSSTKKVLGKLDHFTGSNNAADEDDSMVTNAGVEAVGFNTSFSHLKWCATGGSDGVLKIWDLSSGQFQCRQQCHHGNDVGITKLQWHSNVSYLIYTSATDGSIRLWDSRSGTLVKTFTGGHSEILNDLHLLTLNPTTDIITTVSDDHSIKLFEHPIVQS